MGLKSLSARHLDIIRRLIVGETAQEICLEMGLCQSRISILKGDPLFASAYHEMEMQIAENFIESRANAMEILEDAAPDAARLTRDAILGSIDGEEVPQGLRLKSAWDCLDRTGNKAAEKHLVGHVDLGQLIGEAYKGKYAEGSPAPDDNRGNASALTNATNIKPGNGDGSAVGNARGNDGNAEWSSARPNAAFQSIPKELSLMVVEGAEFGSSAPSTPGTLEEHA